jgi:hypothetical protein
LPAPKFAFLLEIVLLWLGILDTKIQVSLPKYLCVKDSGRARPLVRDSPLRGQSLSQAGKDAGSTCAGWFFSCFKAGRASRAVCEKLERTSREPLK